MIEDPYKVLGVSRDATPEEIKSAYRKLAKQYHPDLHPDDPDANQKMNDINTAYDMIQHPEQYRRQGYSGNPYSYSGSSTSSGSGSTRYGQYTYGPFDWSVDFEDIFTNFAGYAGSSTSAGSRPQSESSDSSEVRAAVEAINSGRYRDAILELDKIPLSSHNARWYYLSALANHGLGNSPRDEDMLQNAIHLDPYNEQYRTLLRQYQSARYHQRSAAQTFTWNTGCSSVIGKFIVAMLVMRVLSYILRILFLPFGF